MNEFSKTLIFFGVIFIAVGVLVAVAGKVPGIGKLPGDIYLKKGSFTFYFPLATSLVISLLLTLFFNLFGRK